MCEERGVSGEVEGERGPAPREDPLGGEGRGRKGTNAGIVRDGFGNEGVDGEVAVGGREGHVDEDFWRGGRVVRGGAIRFWKK